MSLILWTSNNMVDGSVADKFIHLNLTQGPSNAITDEHIFVLLIFAGEELHLVDGSQKALDALFS